MEACGSATGRMGHVYGGSFGRAGFGDRSRVVFRRPRRVHVGGGGFSDDGHLRYYVRCGGKTAEEKRAKLMKKLSKDLAALMRMEEECREGVVGVGVGETTTKEAADILLAELVQLRAKEKVTMREKEEEKATKRMMKKKKEEEEKAMNKMKKTCKQGDMMSSSSSSESSESSDSECDEAVDIAGLRAGKSVVDATQHTPGDQVLPAITSENNSALQTLEQKSNVEQIHGSLNSTSVSNGRSNTANSNGIVHPQVNPVSVAALTGEAQPVNKIEVCVGGKCKKSGALQLMEELEKVVGGEGAVVGCKCMGKCKDGPNVRVLNHCNEGEDVSMPLPRNPLCIGVGLEDVEVIITNYFGKNDMGLLAA